jgi:hypothetical protein
MNVRGVLIALVYLSLPSAAFAEASASRSDPNAVRRALSNMTTLSLSAGHGPQISYRTVDGRVFLWYPGNRVVLRGRWDVNAVRIVDPWTGAARQVVRVCYAYGRNTFNPVTGSVGGGWECSSASRSLARVAERARGDIFQLARRSAPPFVLSRQDLSFALVRRKARASR